MRSLITISLVASLLVCLLGSCCCRPKRYCDWNNPATIPVTYDNVYYKTYYGSNTDF